MTDSGTEAEIVHASVGVQLVSVSRLIGRGSLRYLVSATITVNDVEFAINGIGVHREEQGWIAKAPQYRDANGIWRNAVEMDQALLNSVLELLVDELTDGRDPRNSR
jgi:hypothetical protein